MPAPRVYRTPKPLLRAAAAALVILAAIGLLPENAPAQSAKPKTGPQLAAAAVPPVPSTKPRRGTPPARPEQTELPAHQTLLSSTDREIGRKAMKEAEAGRFDAARRIAAQAKEPLVGHLVRWLQVQSTNGNASFDDIAAFVNRIALLWHDGLVYRPTQNPRMVFLLERANIR